MIISCWKPKYFNSGVSKKISYYYKCDMNELYERKHTGLKVIYICDYCDSGDIYNTVSSSLLSSKYNNLNDQMCRSCRCKISEYETKKSRIPYSFIRKSIEVCDYKLLTSEDEYMRSDNSSQFKLEVICDNGHKYTVSWNNWDKGRRCGCCYKEKRYSEAVKYKDGFELYEFLVNKETETTYKEYEYEINPLKLERGMGYHLDHIYSISEGFRNNIPVHIISSKYNLRMLESNENIRKGYRCDITIEELMSKIII